MNNDAQYIVKSWGANNSTPYEFQEAAQIFALLDRRVLTEGDIRQTMKRANNALKAFRERTCNRFKDKSRRDTYVDKAPMVVWSVSGDIVSNDSNVYCFAKTTEIAGYGLATD